MATLGQFADLSAYRPRATQNPLDALIQGFQTGQAAVNLPEQLRQQQVAQQLAAQLQAVNLQRAQLELENLQNPDRAIARQIQTQLTAKRYDPTSGVIDAIPGFETVPIARPRAISPSEQQYLELGGEQLLSARQAPLSPIEPFLGPGGVPSGFAFDPTRPEAVSRAAQQAAATKLRTDEEIKQGFEIERINARNAARNFRTYINPNDPTDIRQIGATERPPEGFLEAKDYLRTTRGSAGRAGAAGAGGLKPPASAQSDYLKIIGLNRELIQTKSLADEVQKTGKFPDTFQVSLNQFLASRPEDIPGAGLVPGIDAIYAGFQRQAAKVQTKESMQLEARRAFVAATLIRIQAGLAQTNAEYRNIGPTTPKTTDTYEQLAAKLDILTKRNTDEILDYQTLYPELKVLQVKGLESPAQAQAPAGRSFTSGTLEDAEAAAREAGYQTGDIVILNGQTGVLE